MIGSIPDIIFEKYVYEGFGAQRLSRWLYNNGYLNRKGTNFANTIVHPESMKKLGRSQNEISRVWWT